MNEQLEKLKAELAENVTYSKEREEAHVIFDEDGPAGFSLIQAIIDVLEAQVNEIELLKAAQKTR